MAIKRETDNGTVVDRVRGLLHRFSETMAIMGSYSKINKVTGQKDEELFVPTEKYLKSAEINKLPPEKGMDFDR